MKILISESIKICDFLKGCKNKTINRKMSILETWKGFNDFCFSQRYEKEIDEIDIVSFNNV